MNNKITHIFWIVFILLFMAVGAETARRIIVGTGDIIKFDLVTRTGVDSMAGVGLVGTDTELQYDSSLIYTKTEVDALVTSADTGVWDITAGTNLSNSGTANQPILNVDGYSQSVLDSKFTDLDTAKYDSPVVDALIAAADTGVQEVNAGTNISLTGTADSPIINVAITEPVDFGGYKATEMGDATDPTDAVNLQTMLNTYGIILDYWLMPSNSLGLDLIESIAYDSDVIVSTPQTLSNIYFKSIIEDTPTPFVIKDGSMIQVHFEAKVASTSGTKPTTLHAEFYYMDSDGTSNPQQIGGDGSETATLTEDKTAYYTFIHVDTDIIVPDGKRLWLQYVATTTGATNNPTVWVYNGSFNGHIDIGVSATVLGRYLLKAGGEMTGNITMSSSETVDGRDISIDGAVLDEISGADSALHYHNDHYGLQGGTSDEYYHTTSAKYTFLEGIEADSTLDTGQKANFATAYGWGDHSDQNYFDTDIHDFDDVPEGTTYKRLTATKEAYIDQDVTISASPTHEDIYVTDGGFVGISTADSWLFDSSNGDISTMSKVGIGTDSPNAPLNIKGKGTGFPTDFILLENPSVNHGITTSLPSSNTVFSFKQFSSSSGGGRFAGASSSGATPGLSMEGIIGVENPTDTTPAILFVGQKKNGVSVQAMGDDETVFQIKNGGLVSGNTIMTILGSGNVKIGDTTPNHKLDVAGNIGIDTGAYYNFGDIDGTTGYGFRDNSGAIEYKDSGESWNAFHTYANQTLLDAIAADSTLDVGQKSAIDLNTTDRHASASDNQDLWDEIRTDTGTTSATSATDALWITGGTDIGVYSDGDTIIIEFEGSAGGAGDMLKSTYDPNEDGIIAEAQLKLDISTINLWKDIQILAFRTENYEYMIDGFRNRFDVEDEGLDLTLSDTYSYDADGDYYYQEIEAGAAITSPVLHYKMNDDDASTTVVDDADSKDGTLQGGDNTSVKSEVGKINDCLHLNGSDDYISYPALSELDSTTPSISFWVYLDQTPSTAGRNFALVQDDDNSSYRRFGMYIRTDNNKLAGYWWNTSNAFQSMENVGIEALTAGTWHHVVLVFNDSGTARFYLNGDADGTNSVTGTLRDAATYSTAAARNIGAGYFNNPRDFLDGKFDDVRFYDFALSQAEVTALYNSNSGTEEKNPTYGNGGGGGDMELYTSADWTIGIEPVTIKALIFANQAPTSVKLSRTPTGTTMTSASLADTDIESSGLYAYTYTADVSGENSDTAIRCLIVADTSVIHIEGLSLGGWE